MMEAERRPFCWPWSHNWPRWRDLRSRELDMYEGEGEQSIEITQQRRCERCGRLQLRKVKA